MCVLCSFTSKGYFCLFQPLTMHLACVNLRMTMEESLVAATINAAASLGRAHSHGSLEPGKVADMLVIDAPRYMGLVPRGPGGGVQSLIHTQTFPSLCCQEFMCVRVLILLFFFKVGASRLSTRWP